MRLRLLITSSLVLLGGLSAPPAQATVFHVTNDQGTPQAGAYVRAPDGSIGGTADANGDIHYHYPAEQPPPPSDINNYEGAQPSSRRVGFNLLGRCDGRELDTMTWVDIPDPAPAEMNVVLPALVKPMYPELSGDERRVIGLINNLRRENGVAPAPISLTLSRAADGQADWLIRNGMTGSDHCRNGGPQARAFDQGWPDGSTEVYENLVGGSPDPDYAFRKWVNSSGHREALLWKENRSWGIGQVSGIWVLLMAHGDCPSGLDGRCRITTDYGDLNARGGNPSTEGGQDGGDGTATASTPNLQTRLLRRGRTVRITITYQREATGRLTARLTRRGGGRATLRRVSLAAGKTVYQARLARGSWRLRATYSGTRGWTTQTVSRALTIR